MARYMHVVDSKGRVIVPSKIRERFDGVLIVTVSLDEGYLNVYTKSQFDKILEQFSELQTSEVEARLFRRQIIGEAVECELDGQGRISIPNHLWERVFVSKGEEICFIDVYTSVEICSKAFYEKEQEAAASLSELDLSAYGIRGL
ncbi:MAG: cell division/cell wall cluster transcriptional repressor MraZ [Eubacteriales bacterium]|nr:cell division/cell wall cluster transcriptional repressor MraZ [Eubacteriales bacterium]MDD4323373.1 cell division/cell wall cluster transcriptional repressor MraZ [Eubacteriales bacterium]MDD4541210.1 cell division/cell wall cluster transcriptional repressor MraZ [Eubacteriales bacterium]